MNAQNSMSVTSMMRSVALLCLVAPLAGCFSPGYPATPFWCTADAPYCPSGYECALDEGPPDPANPDHRLCKKPGGGVNPGGCLDDDLENPPNDTAQTATNLDSSLQSHPQGVSLYGVEICTPEDVDYYSFMVTGTAKHALVVIQYQRASGELDAQLLDPSLTPLSPASPTTGGLQLEADLEPQSMVYYLVVKAGPGGSKNRYDFSITFSNL